MTEVQPKPHSHRKYVLAIVAVGIVAVLVGAFIRYQRAPSGITFVQGSVVLSPQIHGTPYGISFSNMNTGNLTVQVFANQTYYLYLPTGYDYAVTVQWLNATSGPELLSCAARPAAFTTSGLNQTEDFDC